MSGASTGTYNIDSGMDGMTELQVGSYVVMDVDYRRIGGKSGEVYTDFKPALTVLANALRPLEEPQWKASTSSSPSPSPSYS